MPRSQKSWNLEMRNKQHYVEKLFHYGEAMLNLKECYDRLWYAILEKVTGIGRSSCLSSIVCSRPFSWKGIGFVVMEIRTSKSISK